jgi:disulfide bond formation protein DsbB
MMTLAMVSLLLGAALGQRFSVLALVPAVAFVLALALGTGIAHAHTAWWTLLMAVTAAFSVQVGYLFGIGARHVLVGALASRSPVEAPTASARHSAH